MQQSPMIEINSVSKSYGSRVIFENISLDVMPLEVLAVIGPSGCGKSTLLRLISGLESADSGDIQLLDENLTLVFQYSALFDSLTVFENVAFSLLETPDFGDKSLSRQSYTMRELRDLVRDKLRLVGLGDVLDMYPNQLSGGMQKRVSFARAIVSDPRIILYDEPTAGLDPIASSVIENYILTLRDQIQTTSIVVTHNLTTVEKVADKVCLLFDGQVQWYGTTSDFFTTDNIFARQFARGEIDGPMTPQFNE